MASLYRSLILLLSFATIQVQGGYHQQQPELQQSTLHADSPSARPKLSRPTCMNKEESEPYLLIQENDEHLQFFKKEYSYFKSEYHYVRKLSEREFDDVHLAIKKSSGLKVVYKIIKKRRMAFYTLESSPPPECHGAKVSTLDGKHAGARCMSPRPQNILLPPEVKIQEYLSQPGYENSYVPRVIDYVVTKKMHVLVMEYFGEGWVDLNRMNQDNSVQAKSSNSESGSLEVKPDASDEEIGDMNNVGSLLYLLLTSKDLFQNSNTFLEEVVKELRENLDNPESQLTINAANLVASLYDYGSPQMTSIETILGHPFFTSQ
ncbi:hypothetical protein BASA50_006068 [Batrachochytrium salamandrivorans]|uniref:Protein kinase domain-containing protein n=1 Tax=Batrachochytrium salamandrivorans TaxID=1357716 RepID=A0ABQ8FCM7_9FUNG|nr:hypothetical protein BASA50_006068 [Batrachochytrium salamandrivorans]